MESNITESSEHTFGNSTTLQKLVPVKPLAEQLLLNIEKAEVVSGSFVVSLDFTESEVTIEEEITEETNEEATEVDQVDPQNQEIKKNLENETTEMTESDNSEEEATKTTLPQGIQKITVTMDVESPSYFELETFIDTLENSERIMVVDSINFTGNEEITSNEQELNPISYQVTLSAFYMPQLTDLIDQLPKIDSPEPAKKKNPFSQFSYDLPNQNQSNNASTSSPIIRDGDNIIYTVKPGDTLFDLSLEYYHSLEGIKKIREANGISGHLILIGQKLTIPLKEEKNSQEE